jgi:hypothetical protein
MSDQSGRVLTPKPRPFWWCWLFHRERRDTWLKSICTKCGREWIL